MCAGGSGVPRALAFVLCLFAAGCAAPAPEESQDVVASFYPLEYLARRIAQPDVNVSGIVPAGVEPHDYEPTTGDARRVADAKVLVIQGAGFEGWLDDVTQGEGPAVLVATKGLELRDNPDVEESEELPVDPHTWLDPVLMVTMARNIEEGLSAAYPEHAPAFRARVATLVEDLEELHAQFEAGLAECEVRVIVTNHAAFGYLTARYDIEMIAISGLEPEAEPGPATLQRVIEEVRRHGLTVVFFEDLVSPKVAEAVAREANATARVLSPIEGIPPEDVAAGADYMSRMRDDLAALRDGMRCK